MYVCIYRVFVSHFLLQCFSMRLLPFSNENENFCKNKLNPRALDSFPKNVYKTSLNLYTYIYVCFYLLLCC